MTEEIGLKKGQFLARTQEKWLLVALLLLAFGLRIVALDNAPPGLRYDELQNYLMAGRVLAGERPLYFAESWGHEPLYHYLQAGSLALLGESDWSLRLPSVILSMVALASTWLVAKIFLGRRAAFLALAFLSLSFWGIFYGRVGLRVGGVTAFASLMVFFLWRSWARPPGGKWRGLADGLLAGVFLAAGVYTYLAGRVLPAIFLGFLLFTAVFHWQKFKARWPRFALLALVAGLLCWPLWRAIAANPTGEQRLALLNEAVVSLQQGDPGPVSGLTIRALGMYVVSGEQDWLYNAYGRPIFGLVTGLFFLGGLAWAIWQWRQPKFALLLLWFFGGTGPSMIAPPAASVTHSILAQPVAYLFLGLGLTEAWRRVNPGRTAVAAGLLGLLFIYSGVEAGLAYFRSWNAHPEVRLLYQAGITAVADAIQAEDADRAVLNGGPFVNYWHPWNAVNFELAAVKDVSRVRWFNPAGAWVWPATRQTAKYYFPEAPLAAQQFDAELMELLGIDEQALQPDLNGFARLDLAEAASFDTVLQRAGVVENFSWPPDSATSPVPVAPVQFEDRLWLLAATEPVRSAGNTVRFLTFWQVQKSDPSPLLIFVHLTSDGIDIWGQQDWLDVRLAGLQPGDRFVQVHTVPLSPEAPPGSYHLQLGVYRPDTLARLAIATPDGRRADRLFVGEIDLEQ